MKTLSNFHIITVTYLGATNFKGSRVKLHSDRFNESKIINYDHSYNNTSEIAQAYLESKGFELIGHGEATNGYYLISNTFESIK